MKFLKAPFLMLCGLLAVAFTPSCDVIEEPDSLPDSLNIVLQDDHYETFMNQPILFNFLLNDSVREEQVTVQVGDPAFGQVDLLDTTAAYIYIPNDGFTGRDSLTYQVCAGSRCASGKVVFTVKPIASNCQLEAVLDTVLLRTGTFRQIAVLNNDVLCGAPVTLSIVEGPFHGNAEVDVHNTVWYMATQPLSGTDSLKYRICDGQNNCKTAMVKIFRSITNECQNLAAHTDSLEFVVHPDSLNGGIYHIDVLANDEICNSQEAQVSILQHPEKGSAAVDGRYIVYTAANELPYHIQMKYNVMVPAGGQVHYLEGSIYISIRRP